MGRLPLIFGFGSFAAFGLTGCKSPSGAAPAPSAMRSSSAPQPSTQAETKLATASFAAFGGTTLLLCFDLEAPSSKLRKFAEGIAGTDGGPGFTKLNQTCESLGRVALTTCTTTTGETLESMHYYDLKHSDKYMLDCLKSGGKWETRRGPDAEAARAQQELEALQKKMGQ